jgi:WG containing repeat
VIEPRFDRVQHFRGPYAPARLNKLYGFIDRDGVWVLEPKYDMVGPSGLLPKFWWSIKVGEKYGALDNSLKVVVGPQFDQTPALCTDDRILGSVNRKLQLFARDGTPIGDDASCDSMISTRRK